MLDELPRDVLDAALLLIDLPSLGMSSCASRRVLETVRSSSFLRRLRAARGVGDASSASSSVASASATPLEALAAHEALQAISSNHIIFHLASLTMVRSSARLLQGYSRVMRKHPKLLMKVEAHCGVGAPGAIAARHSVERGCVVARYLVKRGVAARRVEVRAWGKVVGLANLWPGSQRFARAEVFFAFEGERRGQAPTRDSPTSAQASAQASAQQTGGISGHERTMGEEDGVPPIGAAADPALVETPLASDDGAPPPPPPPPQPLPQGYTTLAVALDAAAMATAAAEAESASTAATAAAALGLPLFPLAHCVPPHPPYYEGLDPEVELVESHMYAAPNDRGGEGYDDAADDDDDGGGDAVNSGSDDEHVGGFPLGGMQSLVPRLMAMRPDTVVTLSNGQTVAASELLGILLGVDDDEEVEDGDEGDDEGGGGDDNDEEGGGGEDEERDEYGN